MPNLSAKYLGIDLRNPLIVGASSLTSNMDSIKRIEEEGAGALVIKSLFEEQIAYQRARHEDDLELYDNWHAEMTSVFPKAEHAGPEEHLMWTAKAKEALSIPVIASLNALNADTWSEWALRLEQCGVDALELNFFSLPDDLVTEASEVEAKQVEALSFVKRSVKIPVSVKLSSFYTSPLNFMSKLEDAGADGFVLFNRLFHPVINIETQRAAYPFNLSSPADHALPLRFMAIMPGRTKASLCASNGIHSGQEAIELLLAGADVFQVVSTLYLNKLGQISVILDEIKDWMDKKGYATLDDFRGKLSEQRAPAETVYKRAQYVRMLLGSKDYISRPSSV